MVSKFAGRRGVLLVLLLAWALLLLRLQQVPPGFQHDQSFSVRDALEVLGGHFPIYFPDNFGRGPLFMYSAAGIIGLAGGHLVWSLRFTAVIWGMLGLATGYALARRWLPAGAALLALALMAGSFWFLLVARLGVEPVALLPLATALFYCLHRGLVRRAWRDFAMAGILAGAAEYTYLASRTLYALPPAVALYLVGRTCWLRWRGRTDTAGADWRTTLGDLARLAVLLGLALAVSAPLLLYLRAHSGSDGRIGQLGGALSVALAGHPGQLMGNMWDTVRSILWSGVASLPYHYGLPGRPVLQPVWALLLLVGLAVTLRRAGRPEECLLLLALGLALGPDLLTGADALYMRAVYGLPLLFILAARGLRAPAVVLRNRLGGRLRSRLPAGYLPYARGAALATAAGLVLWQAADNGQAYFITWAQAEQTQRIYNGDFRAVASYVDSRPAAEQVFFGTDRDPSLDPVTYGHYEPRRQDVRWYGLAYTPPLPANGSALYVLPGNAHWPAGLAALADIQRDPLVLPGPNGSYDLVRSLRLEGADVQGKLSQWGVRPPAAVVTYGGCLRLEGAAFRDLGDRGELISWWLVTGPWPRAARPGYPPARPKFAVSATDAAGYRWAQNDALTTLPFQAWQSGDYVLEITPLDLPGDLLPGDYSIRLAIYDDENGPLQTSLNGKPVAATPAVAQAHLSLRPAEVKAAAPPHALQAQAGAALAPLGAWETGGPLIAGAGGSVHLSWQPTASLAGADLHFTVRGRSAAGALLWQQADSVSGPLPGVWPAGQPLRLTHRLAPPAGTPAGAANIEICAERGATALGCAAIGQVAVLAHTPLRQLAAAPQQTSGAQWDGYLTLAGYDLRPEGQAIAVTLYWRVDAPLPQTFKRFLHVMGPDGALIGQSDDELQNGGVPGQLWQPGEYLVDHAVAPINAEGVASGLSVGLYDPQTGDRVPATLADGTAAPDGEVKLALRAR